MSLSMKYATNKSNVFRAKCSNAEDITVHDDGWL